MIGSAWTADEPVPMIPTRLPRKSTGACGHSPVWYVWPAKLSRPGIDGILGIERQPVAMIRKAAVSVSPRSVVTFQRMAPSSRTALVTLVPNSMSRRRSNRSAT